MSPGSIAATVGLVGGAVVAFGGYALTDARSPILGSVVMPAIRMLDPESSHHLAIWLAAHNLAPRDRRPDDEILKTTVFGREFSNPVGLAAGFDKQAEAMDNLLQMGFGFVEIGSVTPLPQPGNPKPRMFRLSEDNAVINRYGFNSDGIEPVKVRLAKWDAREGRPAGLVGVNLGKNKTQTDAKADYERGLIELAEFADYVVINVSSPNTPGLRALQSRDELDALVAHLQSVRKTDVPLLLKIAPDLNDEDKRDIASVALARKLSGLIVSNTTSTLSAVYPLCVLQQWC